MSEYIRGCSCWHGAIEICHASNVIGPEMVIVSRSVFHGIWPKLPFRRVHKIKGGCAIAAKQILRKSGQYFCHLQCSTELTHHDQNRQTGQASYRQPHHRPISTHLETSRRVTRQPNCKAFFSLWYGGCRTWTEQTQSNAFGNWIGTTVSSRLVSSRTNTNSPWIVTQQVSVGNKKWVLHQSALLSERQSKPKASWQDTPASGTDINVNS